MINPYWLWEEIIPKAYCDFILSEIDWNKLEPGRINCKVSKTKALKKRNSNVVWQDPWSVVGCVADTYIRAANNAANWHYRLGDIESVQISKYGIGNYYQWHSDSHVTQDNPRKLSFVLLLNDPTEFSGGAFEFEDFKTQPMLKQGSIIVFPSFMKHRVAPVTEGVRYSAVAWMRGPNFI